MNDEQPDGRYPAPQPCPRCGGEMWMAYLYDCISRCDRCARTIRCVNLQGRSC